MNNSPRCDIFCNVIDNYGDVGVSWRLARQLANEFSCKVRLWVDDLQSFVKLCPEADVKLTVQRNRGVEIHLWCDTFEGVCAADFVIEAFACNMPDVYLAAMAARDKEPVWVNLEYLSAEAWIEGCHKLPSPKPPLTRYFFFPGFTRRTGGLLLEHDLLARRDEFQSDTVQQANYWKSLGIKTPDARTLKISMFAYENEALSALFDVWVHGCQPILCLVPEGRILPQVLHYFGNCTGLSSGVRHYLRGNLEVVVLSFVEQERYDELLWACDINFVRGEDSCVRAQWAGKPFVWQIYPQHDAVHRDKLQAFLDLYGRRLSLPVVQAMHDLWRIWNGESGGANVESSVCTAWLSTLTVREEWNEHATSWALELSKNTLALNLLDFFRQVA